MKYLIFILLLAVSVSSCAQKQVYKWDEDKQTFEAPAFNLKWDLSEFGDWRIADKEQLPSNMLFCGAVENICVALMAVKNPGNVSINDGAEEFINGFLSTAIQESKVFPGLKRGATRYEKCHYLFKDAIRFGAIEMVKDARQGTGKPVKFLYGGYVFEKDGMVFMPLVLLPFDLVETYGDSAMELFFQRFSYINASKELHK